MQMVMSEDILLKVESIIGYSYKNKELLTRALTHNSGVSKLSKKSYQNLEFLGDSILSFVIAEELLSRHPNFNEGQLTRMRATIVSDKPLADTIERLKLNEFLIMGFSETKMKINKNLSVMEDMFEAIVGSIYLDGGMQSAKKFILTALEPVIKKSETDKNDFYDYKSILNEYATKAGLTIRYAEELDGSIEDGKPAFEFNLYLDGEKIASGCGENKKDAQQEAAKNALKIINAKK